MDAELDYSNTIIYKISCKDTSVTDLYVGHTINFVQRQLAHKYSCINDKSTNYNCKLYQTIRKNGGWNNWTMNIVNFFNCVNKTEAREKEQEYYKLLGATLNGIEPLPNKAKVKSKMSVAVKKDNKQQKFCCAICKYSTCRKSQYDRHLATSKHKSKTSLNNTSNTKHKEYKCSCGKIYSYDSGYYRHKRTCNRPAICDDKQVNLVSMYNELKQVMGDILNNIKQIKTASLIETEKNAIFNNDII